MMTTLNFIRNLFIFVLLMSMQTKLCYAKGQTFPPDHWIYKAINTLINQGYLQSLKSLSRPYSRLEVAETFFYFDKSEIENHITLALIDKIEKELSVETNELQNNFFPLSKVHINTKIFSIIEKRDLLPIEYDRHNLSLLDSIPLNFRFKGRLSLGFSFLERFTFSISGIVQQDKIFDENYTLPYQTFFVEQGYAAYHDDLFYIKIGRDYVDWGVSKNKLGISFNARPLNHILSELRTPPVKLSFIISETQTLNSNNPSINVKSYISAAKVDLNFQIKPIGFFFSLWQIANQPNNDSTTINWSFINPITIYLLQKPLSSKINTLSGLDFSISYSGINLYGSLALNLTSPIDENERVINDNGQQGIAWVIGASGSDLLRFASIYGTELVVEGGITSNNAFSSSSKYNTLSFTHNSFWLGNSLGTNIFFFETELSHWFFPFFQTYLNFFLSQRNNSSEQNWKLGAGAYFHYWNFLRADFNFNYLERRPLASLEVKQDFQVKLNVSLNLGIFFNVIEEK